MRVVEYGLTGFEISTVLGVPLYSWWAIVARGTPKTSL
jgi:hypothetical protein